MTHHTNVATQKILLGKWRLDKWNQDYVWARGHTYAGHMYEVMHAVQFLFNVKDGIPGTAPAEHFGESIDARFRDGRGDTYPSFGHALYDLMDMQSEGVSLDEFYRWSFLAALAHDLGKAGGEFQEMLWKLEDDFQDALASLGKQPSDFHKGIDRDWTLKGKIEAKRKGASRYTQAYRHEYLSALLMFFHPELKKWFRKAAGSDKGFGYVVAGALGHHLKGTSKKGVRDAKVFSDSPRKPVYLSCMSRDLRNVLRRLEGPVTTPMPELQDWDGSQSILQSRSKMEDALDEAMFEDWDFDMDLEADSKVSAAVKWMVILSDTLGSVSQQYLDEEGKWESTPAARKRHYRSLSYIFRPSPVDYKERALYRLLAVSSIREYRDEMLLRMAEQGEDQDAELARLLQASDEEITKFIEDSDRATIRGLTREEVDDLLFSSLKKVQRECAEEDGNLLLTAATGSGKTVGAFAWAAKHPHKRMVFATPTTDTATRLYYDYADKELDLSRHSRAGMDVAKASVTEFSILSTPEDSKKENEEAAEEDFALAETFKNFDKDIVYTTVDQVLGVLAYYRNSVMWLPYLLSSQIVFDEFHDYDDMMTGWYFKFLRWFPKLRTAHLSATVNEELREKVGTLINRPVTKAGAPTFIRDTSEGVRAKRYRFHIVDPAKVDDHFNSGTLWICNTVAACQGKAKQFNDALVYHSRFRYVDRNGRRKGVEGPSRSEGDAFNPSWSLGTDPSKGIRDEVVEAFDRSGPRSTRALATQVAEMSLDISARSMITQLCPPPALVQRIGRVNRVAVPDEVADIYVYYPKDEMSNGLPYSTKWSEDESKNPLGHGAQSGTWEEDYDRWLNFIESNLMSPDGVSQLELDEAFQQFYRSPENRQAFREAHTNMILTYRRNLRHGSVTVQSVLRSDLDAYEAEHNKPMPKWAVRWAAVPAILNATQRKQMRDRSSLHEHHYVIEDVAGGDLQYCPRLGLYNPSKI